MKIFEYEGILLRKESTDIDIYKGVKAYTKKLTKKDFDNKVVLDLGGCFGAFSFLSLKNNAKLAIIVEPRDDNVWLMKKNFETFKKHRFKIYQSAVISGNRSKIPIYINELSKSYGSASVIKKAKRKIKIVDTVNFKELLHKYNPNILKIDIEGAEFALMKECKLPKSVNIFIIEMHFNFRRKKLVKKIKDFRIQSGNIAKQFSSWECLKYPNQAGDINMKQRNITGIWRKIK